MTFTFQPGNQGARFLDIPIVDDDIPESVETFQVELFIEPAFTNFASRVNPFLSPVTIIDGDSKFCLSFLLINTYDNSHALYRYTVHTLSGKWSGG